MTKRPLSSVPGLGRRGFLVLAAAGAATTLAGCMTTRPPITYDLVAGGSTAAARRPARTVLIAEPEAIQTYDTDRIIVREAGSVLSYLPEAQWSDRLPRLVQTRMIQAFQDAGVSNVGRVSDPLDPDLILASDIRAFELDVDAGRVATVSLAVRLVDDWNRRLVASSRFTGEVPIASSSPAALVPALGQALDSVLGQVIAWTVQRA